MSIAAIAIVTNSLPYLWFCCTDSKAHSTDGTPHIVMRTGVVFCVNTETEPALEIFYGNIRSVSNKQTEVW
jgi:hypothetical protein